MLYNKCIEIFKDVIDIKALVLVVGILIVSLTACSPNAKIYDFSDNSQKTFSITKQQEDKYIQEIKDCLALYHWKYDIQSVLYSEKQLVYNDKFEKICEASSSIDMDLMKYKGNTVIQAEINLLHFSSEPAGTVYFYFFKDTLVGSYYSSQYDSETVFSLKDRNIFITDTTFNNYEDTQSNAQFNDAINIKSLKNGFCSIGTDSSNTTVVASIENNKVVLYKYRNNNFYISNTLDFSSTNLLPIDVMLFKNGDKLVCTVLLGTLQEIKEIVVTKSKKVVFYGENMSTPSDEIILETENYLSLGYDDDNIILFQGNNMAYYRKESDLWVKYSQIMLESEVQSFIKSDLDGDNIYEYIMTNGKDIYIYHQQGKLLKNIWQTHISVENFWGDLFTADLNNDGVKEIYIIDSTGTTIRYILDNKGFISQNEDIDYGEQIYPGDFNGDGKDDYIKFQIDNNTTQQLYINNGL